MSCLRRALEIAALFALVISPLHAQADPEDNPEEPNRLVEFRFTPTERAQLALWVEKADGTFMRTVRLTEAVGLRGIGNRPGALQFNSGFHYPYGRREGVLPVWAHRRYEGTGEKFPRVIFWGRESEGYASIAGDPPGSNTTDDYFCLPFNNSANSLDAVTCASPNAFRSNKGRYMTEEDVQNGYAEPWQAKNGGPTRWREMPLKSLYPPRRDVAPCGGQCSDHEDVSHFAEDAREVMPHIDAVTMATLPGNEPHVVRFNVPAEWPAGDYVAWLEVNVEGDYNEHYNPDIYPGPDHSDGDGKYWDSWAESNGIPYRSQPSVVYHVPFRISPAGGEYTDMELAGYGALHGRDGELRRMDDTITQDPENHPGSGADRLRKRPQDPRMSVRVITSNVCEQDNPPAACGRGCTDSSECGEGLVCGPDGKCVGMCDVSLPPPAISGFTVEPHPDKKKSHRFARLRLTAPDHARPIAQYEVRFSPTRALDDNESFMRAEQAKTPELTGTQLMLPTDVEAGETIERDFGVLVPQTQYNVAVRAQDVCGEHGPITQTQVTTTQIDFTTVSPCFVATAAHGSPMASEVGTLRRLRDRHMQTNPLGRLLVDTYYAVGPSAADFIRQDDTLRAITRSLLSPLVDLAEIFD
jgi:hypothetical protein